jgi:hypothetical protein
LWLRGDPGKATTAFGASINDHDVVSHKVAGFEYKLGSAPLT